MLEPDAGAEVLNLGRDFPPVATGAWEAAIANDLKGADYEKKLVWRSEEGLAIRPYYRQEALAGLDDQLRAAPGHYPFVRGTGLSSYGKRKRIHTSSETAVVDSYARGLGSRDSDTLTPGADVDGRCRTCRGVGCPGSGQSR
jgi:hypothetical protein